MTNSRAKGLKRHTDRLKKISNQQLIKLVGAVTYEGADIIRAEAANKITQGAVSGKGHVPSKPGEPPNEDTGFLRSNIKIYQTGPLSSEVRSEAPYAAALEEGSTRKAGVTSRSFRGNTTPYGPIRAKQGPVRVEFGDSSTAARPYMRPSRDAKIEEVRELLVKRLDILIKKSGQGA